jgi:hypothetical protein
MLNASRLASGLSVSAPTIIRYVDLLADLLLVRRLPPFHANMGKRLVKSPKVYVRDSGVLHALLGIADHNALAGHPVVGASWEGFVIENLLAVAPERTLASLGGWGAGGRGGTRRERQVVEAEGRRAVRNGKDLAGVPSVALDYLPARSTPGGSEM